MGESAPFNDNPFQVLKGKKFPSKKSSSAEAERRKKTHGKPVEGFHKSAGVSAGQGGAQGAEGLSPEDEALFLRAMCQVEPTHTRDAGAFTLAEHCAMPSVKALKQKKARRAEPDAAPADRTAAGRQAVQTTAVRAEAAESRVLAAGQAGLSGMEVQAQPSHEEEDTRAFLEAMGTVEPLQGRGREVNPPVATGTPPPNGELSLQDFMDGKLEFALSFTDEYLEGHVVGLDQMIMNKLRSGGLSPEAHLDLHGLNAQQAFESLRGFMRGSWYKGLRTVLVVPGRGRNSPDGIGILREKLQSWLTQDPFKRVVLAFCTAQPHDGGPGSVYVLLRKYRKKGRIYWERMPADSDLF